MVWNNRGIQVIPTPITNFFSKQTLTKREKAIDSDNKISVKSGAEDKTTKRLVNCEKPFVIENNNKNRTEKSCVSIEVHYPNKKNHNFLRHTQI